MHIKCSTSNNTRTYKIQPASGDRSTHIGITLGDARHKAAQAQVIRDVTALPGVQSAQFKDKNAFELEVRSATSGTCSLADADAAILTYMQGYLTFLSGA